MFENPEPADGFGEVVFGAASPEVTDDSPSAADTALAAEGEAPDSALLSVDSVEGLVEDGREKPDSERNKSNAAAPAPQEAAADNKKSTTVPAAAGGLAVGAETNTTKPANSEEAEQTEEPQPSPKPKDAPTAAGVENDGKRGDNDGRRRWPRRSRQRKPDSSSDDEPETPASASGDGGGDDKHPPDTAREGGDDDEGKQNEARAKYAAEAGRLLDSADSKAQPVSSAKRNEILIDLAETAANQGNTAQVQEYAEQLARPNAGAKVAMEFVRLNTDNMEAAAEELRQLLQDEKTRAVEKGTASATTGSIGRPILHNVISQCELRGLPPDVWIKTGSLNEADRQHLMLEHCKRVAESNADEAYAASVRLAANREAGNIITQIPSSWNERDDMLRYNIPFALQAGCDGAVKAELVKKYVGVLEADTSYPPGSSDTVYKVRELQGLLEDLAIPLLGDPDVAQIHHITKLVDDEIDSATWRANTAQTQDPLVFDEARVLLKTAEWKTRLAIQQGDPPAAVAVELEGRVEQLPLRPLEKDRVRTALLSQCAQQCMRVGKTWGGVFFINSIDNPDNPNDLEISQRMRKALMDSWKVAKTVRQVEQLPPPQNVRDEIPEVLLDFAVAKSKVSENPIVVEATVRQLVGEIDEAEGLPREQMMQLCDLLDRLKVLDPTRAEKMVRTCIRRLESSSVTAMRAIYRRCMASGRPEDYEVVLQSIAQSSSEPLEKARMIAGFAAMIKPGNT